jgi:hypothetical protein
MDGWWSYAAFTVVTENTEEPGNALICAHPRESAANFQAKKCGPSSRPAESCYLALIYSDPRKFNFGAAAAGFCEQAGASTVSLPHP